MRSSENFVGATEAAAAESASVPRPHSPNLSLHVYVTPECNMSCRHCYNTYADKSLATTLTPGNIGALLSTLAARFTLDVELEGGEFFLRPDAADILAGIPDDLLRSTTVTTNGTVPIPKDALPLLRRIGALRISAEGHTASLQAALRKSGLPSLLRTADRLLSADIAPVIRTTLSRANAHVLEEMVHAWAERGITRLSFFELQSSGRAKDIAELLLSETELDDLLPRLADLVVPAGIGELRLSLPRGRRGLASRHSPRLAAAGYLVQEAPPAPSLTLDHDGSFGICPWSVSDDRESSGHIARLDPEAPEQAGDSIAEHWRAGHLNHQCDHCSAVRIIHRQ